MSRNTQALLISIVILLSWTVIKIAIALYVPNLLLAYNAVVSGLIGSVLYFFAYDRLVGPTQKD